MGNGEPEWKMRLLEHGTLTPLHEPVSAVFLIAIRDQSILAVRNERGWDIPGGHVEVDESPGDAVLRETLEEAGARFSWAELFAIVSVRERSDVMLFYTTSSFELLTFSPTEDALERALMPTDEFLGKYAGPAELMQQLLSGARNRIARRE